MPCWIGIIPGKTTFDEGEAQLYRTFGDNITRPYTFDYAYVYLLRLDANHAYQISFGRSLMDDPKKPIGDAPIAVLSLASDKLTTSDGLHLTIGDFTNYYSLPTGIGTRGYHQVFDFGDQISAELNASDQDIPDPNTLTITNCGMFHPHQDIASLSLLEADVPPGPLNHYAWKGFRSCYTFGLPAD